MTLDAASAAWVHSAFAWAGMALGAAMWRAAIRHQPSGGALAPGNFAVVVGLLMGAALGNKAVFLLERPDVALAMWQGQPVWPGQSIVGGLLGGLIGVEIAKALSRDVKLLILDEPTAALSDRETEALFRRRTVSTACS